MLDYAGGFRQAVERVVEQERAGLDLVWVAEAYGFDSPSLMGFLAAWTRTVGIGSSILPVFTRTSTLIAMTAAGIDNLSDGRFELGLGSSGPQVIEGFHGVPFVAPLARTRACIEVCRKVWSREAPLKIESGPVKIPLPTQEGTGLGKPLKIIGHPVRPRIPIWVASLGDGNVALTAELADGWIPFLFVPELARSVWGESIDRGRSRRDPSLGPLQITAGGLLAVGDGAEVISIRERCPGDGRALRRRHGGQGSQLLQRGDQKIRLRARSRADPRPIPGRQQECRRCGSARPLIGDGHPLRTERLRR